MPVGQITVTDGCPTFVTPLNESLLRKRKKLMRKHQLSKADHLSVKIGKLIFEHRSIRLSRVYYRSNKNSGLLLNRPLRPAVAIDHSLNARFGAKFADPNAISEYFADIGTDACYDSCAIEQLIDSLLVSYGLGVFSTYMKCSSF